MKLKQPQISKASSSSKPEGSSTPKSIGTTPMTSSALAIPQSTPPSVANAAELVKKKGKGLAIDEPGPKRQKIGSPGSLMKDARKLSKKDPSSNVIQQYKESLSASFGDVISAEPLFIPLKNYNENASALASSFDYQKKAKDVAKKITAIESPLLKAEITRDEYKQKLNNAIKQIKELEHIKEKAEEADMKLKAANEQVLTMMTKLEVSDGKVAQLES
ncbi:hypothetical protein TorRG33x02_324940 [Trema orientale]|uniref:Uncharacterized protein n=1 Tax=Trema orientale TaxID=63057 RepID=A0A2P5BDH5_TREOI|nr:hypothetical protein TorRG33x02_324940 [Trema orientale]